MTISGAKGERFLAAFAKLKAALDDDPTRLKAEWNDGDQVASLCDDLAQLVRGFEIVEEWSPLAFTNNVSAASAKARRDYDDRWLEGVHKVADRKLLAAVAEFFADLVDAQENEVDETDLPAVDTLGSGLIN
jgi:hypothetical protein